MLTFIFGVFLLVIFVTVNGLVIVKHLLIANVTYPFYKNKMGKRSFFLSYKKKKKRDDFLLPKSSLFFLKPWINEQKISRILFVHPLKICEQYGFIQSCSYKSKALNRPWTIQQKK